MKKTTLLLGASFLLSVVGISDSFATGGGANFSPTKPTTPPTPTTGPTSGSVSTAPNTHDGYKTLFETQKTKMGVNLQDVFKSIKENKLFGGSFVRCVGTKKVAIKDGQIDSDSLFKASKCVSKGTNPETTRAYVSTLKKIMNLGDTQTIDKMCATLTYMTFPHKRTGSDMTGKNKLADSTVMDGLALCKTHYKL